MMPGSQGTHAVRLGIFWGPFVQITSEKSPSRLECDIAYCAAPGEAIQRHSARRTGSAQYALNECLGEHCGMSPPTSMPAYGDRPDIIISWLRCVVGELAARQLEDRFPAFRSTVKHIGGLVAELVPDVDIPTNPAIL